MKGSARSILVVRCVAAMLVAAIMLAALPLKSPAVQAQTRLDMRKVEQGYDKAIRVDEPTRRFVELYLRVAGGIWIAVEWVAAIVLILAYRRLSRWFGEGEASP